MFCWQTVNSTLSYSNVCVRMKRCCSRENFRREIESYLDDPHGETLTQGHDISSDPGPQNTFSVLFQSYIHMASIYLNICWIDFNKMLHTRFEH